MNQPDKRGRRAKVLATDVVATDDRTHSPAGNVRDIGQRSAGRRSVAGSNYGDYVPSRSKQGMQRGGQERHDVATLHAKRAHEFREDPSTASTDIPWQGDVGDSEPGTHRD